ncbi:MAG: YceI family protein [Sandaracinaceae bacterium]|nr:YceI family protein [Sandaracinaceae bacterium]
MTTRLTIDPAHSAIHFSVRHMMFAKVRGRFAAWTGALAFDEADPAAFSVDVAIEAASIDTGVADRDAHLRSADFLDVARFDTIRFVGRALEPIGGGRYRVHGELTIRDVTRPVALETEYAGAATDPWGNTRVAFTATASLDRREFGLQWNQVLEAGGVLVGERIDVELEVQAIRAAAASAA